MGSSLNRNPWIYFGVFTFFVAATWFVPRHIAVTVTPSLRCRVFYLESGTVRELRRGNYVMFALDHPVTREFKIRKAIKEVVCVGGDRLFVSGKDYYCNGDRLGRAKGMSLRGARVDNFKYNGVVPAGSLFVMGHSKDSFDSRYFGFIRVGDVENIAHPIF